MTLSWGPTPWHWHGSLGVVRTEPEVQVDALIGSVRDRTRLVARSVLPYMALGVGRDLGNRWGLGLEVLYVPLAVRRDPNAGRQNDALTSVRMQLRYRGQ